MWRTWYKTWLRGVARVVVKTGITWYVSSSDIPGACWCFVVYLFPESSQHSSLFIFIMTLVSILYLLVNLHHDMMNLWRNSILLRWLHIILSFVICNDDSKVYEQQQQQVRSRVLFTRIFCMYVLNHKINIKYSWGPSVKNSHIATELSQCLCWKKKSTLPVSVYIPWMTQDCCVCMSSLSCNIIININYWRLSW